MTQCFLQIRLKERREGGKGGRGRKENKKESRKASIFGLEIIVGTQMSCDYKPSKLCQSWAFCLEV